MLQRVAVLTVAGCLLAPSIAAADDDYSLGVANQTPEATWATNVRQANYEAQLYLAKHFTRSYLLRERGGLLCAVARTGADFADYDCITAWRYRHRTFVGHVRTWNNASGWSHHMRIVKTGRGGRRVFES